MCARRSFLAPAPLLYQQLWSEVGLPDPEASRNDCIATPEGPRMLIAETYRRGMLTGRAGGERVKRAGLRVFHSFLA